VAKNHVSREGILEGQGPGIVGFDLLYARALLDELRDRTQSTVEELKWTAVIEPQQE
jgi:hypothetical protein